MTCPAVMGKKVLAWGSILFILESMSDIKCFIGLLYHNMAYVYKLFPALFSDTMGESHEPYFIKNL